MLVVDVCEWSYCWGPFDERLPLAGRPTGTDTVSDVDDGSLRVRDWGTLAVEGNPSGSTAWVCPRRRAPRRYSGSELLDFPRASGKGDCSGQYTSRREHR